MDMTVEFENKARKSVMFKMGILFTYCAFVCTFEIYMNNKLSQ